jgi:FkbM family methyltransferase
VVCEGGFALDIGANIGWFTVLMANLVGETGEVIAIEPEPINYELLCDNLRLNNVVSRVKPLQLAISEKTGHDLLHLHSSNLGAHCLDFGGKQTLDGEVGFCTTTSVETIDLDSLFATQLKRSASRRINFVKIDCQGAEVAIMRGGKDTMARVENLLIEFDFSLLKNASFEPYEFFDLLKQHFSWFCSDLVEYSSEKLRPISELDVEQALAGSGSINYLFKK